MIPVPHIYVHCSSQGHAIRNNIVDDPSSTMDFERCKDSVSASIVDDIPVSVTISLRVTGVNEFY